MQKGSETMTMIERLKLGLNNKPYLTDQEYHTLLQENSLSSDQTYNKDEHEISLLSTILDVLYILSNDINLYMKIETEFMDRSEAFSNLERQIERLETRIANMKLMADDLNRRVKIMFTRG